MLYVSGTRRKRTTTVTPPRKTLFLLCSRVAHINFRFPSFITFFRAGRRRKKKKELHTLYVYTRILRPYTYVHCALAAEDTTWLLLLSAVVATVLLLLLLYSYMYLLWTCTLCIYVHAIIWVQGVIVLVVAVVARHVAAAVVVRTLCNICICVIIRSPGASYRPPHSVFLRTVIERLYARPAKPDDVIVSNVYQYVVQARRRHTVIDSSVVILYVTAVLKLFYSRNPKNQQFPLDCVNC